MSQMKLEAPKTLILTSSRDRYGAYWNLWVKGDKTVCHLKKKKAYNMLPCVGKKRVEWLLPWKEDFT